MAFREQQNICTGRKRCKGVFYDTPERGTRISKSQPQNQLCFLPPVLEQQRVVGGVRCNFSRRGRAAGAASRHEPRTEHRDEARAHSGGRAGRAGRRQPPRQGRGCSGRPAGVALPPPPLPPELLVADHCDALGAQQQRGRRERQPLVGRRRRPLGPGARGQQPKTARRRQAQPRRSSKPRRRARGCGRGLACACRASPAACLASPAPAPNAICRRPVSSVARRAAARLRRARPRSTRTPAPCGLAVPTSMCGSIGLVRCRGPAPHSFRRTRQAAPLKPSPPLKRK